MIDVIGKRYWFFGFSAAIIIVGIIALALWGLPLGLDFTGGSLIEVQFKNPPAAVQPGDISTILEARGFKDAVVQTSGTNTVLIRAATMDNDTKLAFYGDLRQKYGDLTELQYNNVGPSVGAAVAQRAIIAVAIAEGIILLYIAWAFRKVQHPLRYGVAAIIALVHDVLVLLGVAAILGHFLGWQVDALFLTAMLTVIGFSVHDTIVVFDRIRENLVKYRGEVFDTVVNFSIIQTLVRSLNTSLTVVITLSALALLGGVTTRHFVIYMLIGIISGTYSSIFNAAPVLVVWNNKEWRRWFRKEAPATRTGQA